MEPGAQPSGAPGEGKAEPQQEAPVQSIEGHGQVMMLSQLWKQEECCVTLQDILEPDPTGRPARPSSIGATSGHSSSSNCSRRQRKRSRDSSWRCAECPAAKSKRCTQEHAKTGDSPDCKCEAAPAPAPAGTSDSEPAEDSGSGCQNPRQRRTARERRARLLLVMCRVSALRSQLPRLQLLLQQVSARERRPPVALVGIIVQPPADEEAEARRLMETLLCGAFAPHSPAVEVHTAVFRPSCQEGALDVRRATCGAHKVAAPGCVSLVDRATQTDGEGPEGRGWERQVAPRVPGVGNFKYGGSPLPPLVPSGGQTPDVTVLLLKPPLNTVWDKDELDSSAVSRWGKLGSKCPNEFVFKPLTYRPDSLPPWPLPAIIKLF